MNLDPLSFSLSQINYLVTNLNKRNFKSSQSELQLILDQSSSVSSAYEAERHLFRYLLSSIDFSSSSSNSSVVDNNQSSSNTSSTSTTSSGPNTTTTTTTIGTGGKDHHQIQLLKEYVCTYLAKPNFATLLCYCIDNPLQFQEVRLFLLLLVSYSFSVSGVLS